MRLEPRRTLDEYQSESTLYVFGATAARAIEPVQQVAVQTNLFTAVGKAVGRAFSVTFTLVRVLGLTLVGKSTGIGGPILIYQVAGVAAQGLRVIRPDTAHHALDVVGCIPLVPGSFAAKAILGLYALTAESAPSQPESFMITVQYTLRVIFTLGAIGTGLALPALLRRVRVTR